MFFEFFEAWYFYYTGLFYCIYLCGQVLFSAAVMVYRTYKPIDFPATYGPNSYALITGATSGIGKQMAFSLCKRGINVIVVGRDPKKLQETRAELLAAFPGRSIVTVVKDFKESMKEGFHKDLYEQTKSYDVSMVINNVGVSYSENIKSNVFIERGDPVEIIDIINVNILSYTLNHFYFYNRFRQRTHCSLFLDVSSINAFNRFVMLNTYSCTKGFNKYLSNSLAYMNTDPKIHFLCFTPAAVDTPAFKNTSKELKMSVPLVLTTERAVESILMFCGITKNSAGHPLHAIIKCAMEALMLIDKLVVMKVPNFILRKMYED
jgi:short-subunit dehydrogenase